MKKYLTLLVCLITICPLHGQRNCGSMEYRQRQIAADPNRQIEIN